MEALATGSTVPRISPSFQRATFQLRDGYHLTPHEVPHFRAFKQHSPGLDLCLDPWHACLRATASS
ncbi:hypothetical protein BDV06DRAFT_195698 [Aspergillus oleicola]